MKKKLLLLVMAIPVIGMAQVASPESTYTALSNSGYTATVDLAEPTQSDTQADALVDGNVATFWETPYSTGADSFPHWLQIDMGSSQSIGGVYIIDRPNAGNSPSICTVSTSTDGTTWTPQGGTYTPGYNQYSEKIFLRFPETVSCKYYKIEFTGNHGTGLVATGAPEYSVINVAETGAIVEDASPADPTAYNRVNWTVSSTSTYDYPTHYDAGFFGTNDLIDQSSTYWRSKSTSPVAEYPHTIVFDMGVSQKINKIYSTPYNGGATQDRAPKEGSIAFSDDGVTFGEETNLDFVTDYVKTYYTFPTVTKRYFRITITKSKFLFENPGDVSDGSKIVSISEIGANYVVVETPLVSDDFEAYTAGSFDGQFTAGEWEGWDGGSSNADVSTDYAVSGTNSLKVWNNAGTETDAVALLGPITTGSKTITMMQYIPSTGGGAYYHLMGDYIDGGAMHIEAALYFSPTVGEFTANSDPLTLTTFVTTPDTWVEQKFVLDYDNGVGQFYYGGTLVKEYAIAGSVDSVDSIDFYATKIGEGGSPLPSLAYYDNFLIAETVPTIARLTEDDFEAYTAGSFDGQFTAGEWEGWDGGSSNADVSTDYAVSGTNSLKVWNNAGTETDAVALLGPITTGSKTITMMQYIPSTGGGAYYHLMGDYIDGGAMHIEAALYFSPTVGEFTANSDPLTLTTFVTTPDTWVEQKFVLDYDNGVGQFYYGGTLVKEYAIAGSVDSVDSIDFYATKIGEGGSPLPSLAYYDNFLIAETISLGIDDFSILDNVVAVQAYPNPSGTEFSLRIASGADQAVNVRVFDILGRLVSTFKTTTGTVMFGSDLKAGIYIAEIVQGNTRQTIKLIKL
jgi:hypothetical protein